MASRERSAAAGLRRSFFCGWIAKELDTLVILADFIRLYSKVLASDCRAEERSGSVGGLQRTSNRTVNFGQQAASAEWPYHATPTFTAVP
jgi:hypothetical protein